MPAYPIQLTNLSGRRVLVAGAGPVAAQKVLPLLAAEARVHLVAPDLSEEIRALEDQIDRVELRDVRLDDVDGAALVIAATDDAETNRALAAAARQRGILINVADDPDYCDFYSPAAVRRGPVTITIGTDGGSPLLAARLRRLFEVILPDSITGVFDLFARARRRGLKGLNKRERLLSALSDPLLGRLVDEGDTDRAADHLEALLSTESFPPGSVAIVGAGPGSRDLLTLRALDRLRTADVILHDALVDDEVLELSNARKIHVGRRAKCDKNRRHPQELTHRIMISEATDGHRVVRLHSGDPMVFGRGGEEVDALREAGVPFEIVPGVSAAIAAPAAAGIPLTHRDEARGFSVRTGHTKTGYSRGELPVNEQTVVVMMGLGGVEEIMRGLAEEGRSLDTPAVCVSRASRSGERVVRGTIGDLAQKLAAEEIERPATLIIGEVARRGAMLEQQDRAV